MSSTFDNDLDLIKDQIKLPSPPAVAVKILNIVQKEDSSLQDLTQIISADPALTIKMLQAANSSLYSLPYKISNIERAVSVLGTNLIKNIALSFIIAQELKGSGKGSFDFDYFWRRSVTTAVAAELLAHKLNRMDEDIFVTALLQDIGVLTMYLGKGQEYGQLLEESIIARRSLRELEFERLGFDHQQVGASLLKSWGLPDLVAEPLRYHHVTSDVPEPYADKAEILKISDKLASIYTENNSAEKVRLLQEELKEKYQWTPEQVRELVDDIAVKSIEVLNVFELEPGEIKPYSLMLQETNEELSRLNLSYEQLVMELKQSKENAQNLADDLQAAVARLKELAFRDSLTGLYNHRYFQETLEKELARSLRYQSSIGLLMFDIDDFKNVNDLYGHPVGDLVLNNISRVIEGAVRPSDVVARYGGEEFAVILPHTNKAGMKVFAERLRRSVEGIATEYDDFEIRVTISVGGSCWTLDNPHIAKKDLIETADKALYISKNSGRNQVTILDPG